MRSFTLLFIFFVFSLFISTKSQEDLPVVTNFEVEKYLGHWYLIASIPKVFDFYCICSETVYTIDPSNSSLVNFDESCRVSFTWAPIVHSRSYAEVDPVDKAKWTNVNTIVGSLSARADYYIFEIEENYQWAVVGSRDRGNLYVLSRNMIMTDDVYNQILDKATSLGFTVSKLEKNKQICTNTTSFLMI